MAAGLVPWLGILAVLGLLAAPAEPGDGELMLEIARGDEQAFLRLYRRHAPVVLGMLTRMLRDRGAAEDELQETFMTVWRQSGRFAAGAASALPWLLVIARNRALDRLRSAAHRREAQGDDLAELAERAAARGGTATAPERMLDGARARAALSGLADTERQCLELAYFEGLSQSEISARLGQPLGTVKSWVRAGLAKLRAAMAPAGAEGGDATLGAGRGSRP